MRNEKQGRVPLIDGKERWLGADVADRENKLKISLMDNLVEIGLTGDEASKYVNLDSASDTTKLSNTERDRLDELKRKMAELKKTSN